MHALKLSMKIPAIWTKSKKKLLEETYKDFVRGGANLDAESQKKTA